MRLTAEIVVAFLEQGSIEPDKLPGLVSEVRRALRGEVAEHGVTAVQPGDDSAGEQRDDPTASTELITEEAIGDAPVLVPAVPVQQSIARDRVICLEDGQPFRSLKRHLMTRHGLTPDEYRAKWGLPRDYPMVAPSYAEARSDVAKKIGLGQSRTPRAKEADPSQTRAQPDVATNELAVPRPRGRPRRISQVER
jgi:predicted transcriptional regulator